MHFSSVVFQGAILTTDDLTSFSVRRDHRYGEELAAIYYSAHPKHPRHIRIGLFKVDPTLPTAIHNRRPKRSPLGGWVLEFGQRSVMPSRRNAILVDDADREVATVRQVEKNALEIDAHPLLGELIVFVIGLSSFACALS
jgi:hypothetical protein